MKDLPIVIDFRPRGFPALYVWAVGFAVTVSGLVPFQAILPAEPGRPGEVPSEAERNPRQAKQVRTLGSANATRARISAASDTVSFSKDIAPIVYRHCASCHRPGGSAPFSLLTYRDVKERAPLIADVTERRVMPPWLPEPGYARFAGERRLEDDEIATIRRWVEQGLAEGDASDRPATPEWNEGWQLGAPDLVIALPPYTVPAHGQELYRNLVATVPLGDARYVSSVEIRPGNPAVHHARLMIDTTASSRMLDAEDSAPGFDGMSLVSDAGNPEGHFLGWTPGRVPFRGADDMAWRLNPGTDLVLQLHLRPTGRPEVVAAEIGLHFAARPPRRTPALIMLGSKIIDIPAGQTDYLVADTYELPVAVKVLGVYPHAHYLGKEMQGFATLPNGTTRWLIRIMDWDFNWQDEYRYREPISLPAGTVLSMRFTYDNSADNPQNLNRPPQRVVYGPNSSDEMSSLAIQVLPGNLSDLEILKRDYGWKDERAQVTYMAHREYVRARELAAQGRFEEAVDLYRASLQFRSDDARVYISLAGALASLGELTAAVTVAERAAVMTDHGDPVVLDALAAAYAAGGQIDRAVRTAQRAIALAADAGALDLANEIRRHLEQYRQRRPD